MFPGICRCGRNRPHPRTRPSRRLWTLPLFIGIDPRRHLDGPGINFLQPVGAEPSLNSTWSEPSGALVSSFQLISTAAGPWVRASQSSDRGVEVWLARSIA